MLAGLFSTLAANLPRLTVTAVIDILLVAYLIYQLLLVVRGTRAAHILLGLSLIGGLYYISILARLETLHSLMANLIPYSMLAVLVLFQSEIRRILGRLGRGKFFRVNRESYNEALDDVLLAVRHLSEHRIGALIVVERDIGLRTFIESGVLLDAHLSYDLLLAIFHPGAPLHDGAAIIQQDRVAAAACFLPLTTNPALASQLGTRHRAAIGVTEESDCVAFVVSEENGRISIAAGGGIDLAVPAEDLEDHIARWFGRRVVRRPAAQPPAVGELAAWQTGEIER